MSGQHPGRYFWEVKVILGSSLFSCTGPCSVARIQANTSLVPLTSSAQTVPRYIVYTVYLQCTCKSALHCYTVYGKWRTNVFFPLVGDILVTNWECIPENCVWRAFSSLKIHGKSFNFWALFLKNIFLQHSNCLSLVECK